MAQLPMMTKTEIEAALAEIPHWYHCVDVGHGIVTPGWGPQNIEHYRLPESFAGKRVLDVGAYDGWFTFEALKRGAREVVAIDNFSDTIHQSEKRSWKPFEFCREALGYTKEQAYCEELSLYELPNRGFEKFDVILFLGGLYHQRWPLLALDTLRAMANPGCHLLVESHISDDYSPYIKGGHGDLSVLEFYPGAELGGNVTNWHGPTLRCISDMMAAAGFANVSAWKIDRPTNLSETRGYAHGFVPE